MIYGCTSIVELKNEVEEDSGYADLIGYRVTHPTAFGVGNTHCDFPIMPLKGYSYTKDDDGNVVAKQRVPMGRDNISNVVKSGSVVTSMREESFCCDDKKRCYVEYTTEDE